MPKRPCLEVGCRSFSVYRGRCKFHNTEWDKSINRSGRTVYKTKAWAILRRRVLFDEPMCRQCQAEGKQELGVDVDHINGDPTDNRRENLAPLCKHCHSRKTRAEQIGAT